MERIRVGIVGCGFISNAHYLGYRNNPQAEVVAVADINADSAKKFAATYGIKKWYASVKDLLAEDDIDAVSVCTPHFAHAEVVVAAAEKGKHVLVEKPFATTTADADKMIDAARRSQIKLMVAFVSRFIPAFKEAKQLIDDGAIGKITQLKSTRWGWIPWTDWYVDPEKGGGLLTDRFCYGADYARWLTGSEVDEVFVLGGALVHQDKARKYGKDFIDNAKVVMRMKNGVLAEAEESYSCKFGYYEKLEIVGEEGLIIADPFKNDMLTLWTSKKSSDGATFFNGLPYSPGWNWPDMSLFPLKEKAWGAFAYEAKHFVDCIINNQQPSVTGEDGKAGVKVVSAAMESHRKGVSIKVE